MPKCQYQHCRNEAAPSSAYCRAHVNGQANRRMAGIVPKVGEQLNATGNPNFETIRGWCQLAKNEIQAFMGDASHVERLNVFFGGNNVPDCLRVLARMPDVLDAWRNGQKAIRTEPMMRVAGAVNMVDKNTGDLTVNDAFPNSTDDFAKWVLVHESAHGVRSLDNTIEHVGDEAYFHDGPVFHSVPGARRKINADHYRMCIQKRAEGVSITDCQTEFGLQNEGLNDNIVLDAMQNVVPQHSFAKMVKNGAHAVLSVFRLHIFDVMSSTPETFASGKFKGRQGEQMQNLLSGKKSSTAKPKDWVRMEDLHSRVRTWLTHVAESRCNDYFDPHRKNMEAFTIRRDLTGLEYCIISKFVNRENVPDKDLARCVKKMVHLVVTHVNPYFGIDGEYITKRVKDTYRSEKKKWFKHL